MLLDSDAVLFVSPETIFSSELYASTGTLFLHDKFIDYWPYKRYDPSWMYGFLTKFNREPYLAYPRSLPSAAAVQALETHPGKKLSSSFLSSTFAPGAPVQTQHLAESSMVLFHKERQHRAVAILKVSCIQIFHRRCRSNTSFVVLPAYSAY